MRRTMLQHYLSRHLQTIMLVVVALAVSFPFLDEAYQMIFQRSPERILTYRANPFEIECSNMDTHHGYCPEIIVKRDSEREDGAESQLHYIDKSSIEVRNRTELHQTTDTAQAEILFVGDSYIQAELIPFDETISALVGRSLGKKVLKIGYNGWTPATEFGWLRTHPLKAGAEVNLFVSADDFMPSNPFSNYRYHQIGTPLENGGLRFPARSPASPILAHPVISGSIFGPLPQIMGTDPLFAAAPNQLSHRVPKPFAFDLSVTQDQCEKLDSYKYVAPRTLDYVRFSFVPKCWDAEQFKSVRSVLSDIRHIHKLLRNSGGKLRVFFIPPGWAYTNEMRVGRQQSVYRIASGASITTQPLSDHIRERLSNDGIEYHSLEEKIRELKQSETAAFYYPMDGRWTRLTHRLLADWMTREIYKKH